MFVTKLGSRTISFTFFHTRGDYGAIKLKAWTLCELTVQSSAQTVHYVGLAFCREKDNFCKETGRKLALARAVGAAFDRQTQKDLRLATWERYFMRAVPNAIWNEDEHDSDIFMLPDGLQLVQREGASW